MLRTLSLGLILLLAGCSKPESGTTPVSATPTGKASSSQLESLQLANGQAGWSFSPPAGESLAGGVVVAEDRILVHTRVAVYALEARSGDKVWRAHCQEPLTGFKPILAAQGKVFCTSGKSIWALDLKNGEPLWTAPKVGHSFSLSGKSLGLMDELKSSLTVLDCETGKELWKTQGAEKVAASSQYFILAGAGQAHACQASNGKVVWRNQSLPAQTTTAEVCSQGVVLLRTWQGMRGLAESDGKQLWATSEWGTDLATQGEVAVICASPAGRNEGPSRAVCISLKDGKERWALPEGRDSAHIGGDKVVVGVGPQTQGRSSELAVLNLADGKELWRKPIPHHWIEGCSSEQLFLRAKP